MEEITLKIKDKSKVKFLKQLLKQLDFVEMKKEKKEIKSDHNIFDSAGLWEGRNINARQLRDEAWNRK
jgi:GMP synthase PP-ATPase subunit